MPAFDTIVLREQAFCYNVEGDCIPEVVMRSACHGMCLLLDLPQLRTLQCNPRGNRLFRYARCVTLEGILQWKSVIHRHPKPSSLMLWR